MDKLSPRMKRLKKAGLLGCLDGTGVTSENYKDKLMEKMEWIKVTDRLPESNQKVLVWDSAWPDRMEFGFYDPEFSSTNWRCSEYMESDVTHWMPLPSLPKE